MTDYKDELKDKDDKTTPPAQPEASAGARRKSALSEVISWVVTLALAIGAGLLMRVFIIEPVRIQGPSMYDTLIQDEWTVLDKISYRFSEPKRGDVINFFCEGLDERLVKRIIGIPGDTVSISGGKVFVNGAQIDEPYIQPMPETESMAEVSLGEDEYFVMGDNRPRSVDSRSGQVGIVNRDSFYGKVVAVIWPLDQLHFGAFTE